MTDNTPLNADDELDKYLFDTWNMKDTVHNRALANGIKKWHNKQVEETMAKFHLEKGVKYDVKASDSVIVITHSNKLKEAK